MGKILTLLSTSFLLISAFESLYARGILPNSGMSNGGVGGSFALFGKRAAAAEKNALLRQTQMQIQMINTNPAAKLAYLRSVRQGLGTKAEFARVRGLPVGQRAGALEQLYARLRAENQALMGRQQRISGGLSMPGMPDFTMGKMADVQGESVEASMNDIALHYKQERRIATSPTLEVGPDDYMMSIRENRTNSISGRSEVGPSDVRTFMQQSR